MIAGGRGEFPGSFAASYLTPPSFSAPPAELQLHQVPQQPHRQKKRLPEAQTQKLAPGVQVHPNRQGASVFFSSSSSPLSTDLLSSSSRRNPS